MDETTKNTNNNEEGKEEEIALPPLSSTSSTKKDAPSNIPKKSEEKKEETVGDKKPPVSSPAQTPTTKPKVPETPKPEELKVPTPEPAVATKPQAPKAPVPAEAIKPVAPVVNQEVKAQPGVAQNTTPLQSEINKIAPKQAGVIPTKAQIAQDKNPVTPAIPTPPQKTVATPAPNKVAPIPTTAKTTPTIVVPTQTTPINNEVTPIQNIAPATKTPTTPLSPADLIKDAKERLAHETVAQPAQQNVAPAISTPIPTAPSVPTQTPIQQTTAPQVNAGAPVPPVTTGVPAKPSAIPKQPPLNQPVAPVVAPTQTTPTQTVANSPLHPPTPQTTPIHTATPAPSTKTLSETGTPTAIPVATPEKKAPFLPNLRTFKGDVSDVMKAKKTSLISMAAAQQDKISATPRKAPKEAGGGNMKKMLIALGGGFLILSGISFAAYTFISQTPPDNVLVERNIPSLIFVDNTQALDISNKSRREVMNGLTFLKDSVDIQLGLLEQIVPIFRDDFDTVEVIDAKTFLTAIDARVLDSLVRSLDPEFTLGVHSFNGNQPFLIFKVKNFRTAFADILSWEDNMSDDLAPLFGLPLPTFIVKEIPVVAEDTASTTPEDDTSETTIDIPQKRVFTDVIIKNQDVRVLKDDDDRVALLYTFPNEETVVITTNENTLSEILTRLGSTRVF